MNLRNALLVVLVFTLSLQLRSLAQTSGAAVATTKTGDLNVSFTGRLLGYYRLPEWQTADFQPDCPDPDRQSYTQKDVDAESNPDLWKQIRQKTPADAFLYHIHKLPVGGVLVGMGDNFGVTLESRTYRTYDKKDNPTLIPKSRDLLDPDWTDPTKKKEIGDNVGCFFLKAGYDALVPGKDDFYFGPARLREIANRLAAAKESALQVSENRPANPHPAFMLASNLVLKTDYLKKPSEIPDADKGLKFIPDMPTGIKSLDISDNGTIPPFTRQIRFEVAAASRYSPPENPLVADKSATFPFRPFLCPVRENDGLDRLNPAACVKNQTAIPLTGHLEPDDKKRAEKPAQCETLEKATWDYDLPSSWPEEMPALYGLCAEVEPQEYKNFDDKVYASSLAKSNPNDKHYYCQRFTVAPPLFGDSATRPWILKSLSYPAAPGCKEGRLTCDGRRAYCKDDSAACENNNGQCKTEPVPECRGGAPACGDDGAPKCEAYAAIFGVVDKDLIAYVGRDNLSWRNEHNKVHAGAPAVNATTVPEGKETYGTTVDALDEATALGLAVRSFDREWKSDPARKDVKPYKILLAQMTRGRAETLAANLADTNFSDTEERFDIVISAAASFSAATANEELTFYRPKKIPEKTKATRPECKTEDKEKETDSKSGPFRHFVSVPWVPYDNEKHRAANPIRSLTLTEALPDSRAFSVGGNYEQSFPTSETIDQDQLEACYDKIAKKFLQQQNYWKDQLPKPTGPGNPPDCSQFAVQDGDRKPYDPQTRNAFELAVLATLRDRTHADVAMLQKRAFYWGPFPLPQNPMANLNSANGEIIDRILWMGEFLQVLSVKGSTLKKVLEESDNLDALDERATNEIIETKRGLLALGVEKTRDKQYLIDGMQLDPNRLYTVATSNHIAAGDNGYPELADPQFADFRLAKQDVDARISRVVCKALGADSCPDKYVRCNLPGGRCVQNPDLLFASIDPPPLPSQLTPAPVAYLAAYERSILGAPDLPRDAFSRTNYQAQLNPTWRISLKDFSLNLSSVRNNLTEAERITELGGVTDSTAAGNAKQHTINFSTHEE
jgi:5'-nucleotidase-like protein